MNQMSIWAALFSLTQTTDAAEAIAKMEADPKLVKQFANLTVGQDWATVRSQIETREDAERLLEIADEWCSFSKAEQKERLEEMKDLFCLSTETQSIKEALAHLDSNDEWDGFIDMVNDPEVFEQDGDEATKEGMLELLEVSFGANQMN
jgi:chaperonin cofactor prefoldin